METLRIKKAPILFPLLFLAAALAVYTFVHFQSVTAADCLTLGQRHLNELDYEGAILEFSNALDLDPNNSEARLGLAQAYAGNEDYALSKEILRPLVYTQDPEESTAVLMEEVLEKSDQTAQAAGVARTLIELTDDDQYYELLDRLLADLRSAPRSYASGTDQALRIRDGRLYSQGSNRLGQLGTDGGDAGVWTDAAFPGVPWRVSCAGRTSLVIDQDGALWAAGENRWGQWGEGSALMAPETGWQRLNTPGKTAQAAGTTGRLLILLEDGTLWTAGAENIQEFTRLARFPAVTEISACASRTAILTVDGALYTSGAGTPARWALAARDAAAFTLSEEYGLCWVDQQGAAYMEGGLVQLPLALQLEGSRPTAIAGSGGGLLCLTQDGALWNLSNGENGEEISAPGSGIAAIYPQGGALILEYDDGTLHRWQADMAAPQELP